MVSPASCVFACPCRYPCADAAEKGNLLGEGDGISWTRGARLWGAGDSPDWMLAVSTGAVGLRRAAGSGTGTLIDIVARGGLAGEEAGLGGCARASDCVGLVAGRGRRVNAQQMARQLESSAQGWPVLLKSTCRRLHRVGERLRANAQDPVSSRLARALVGLAEQTGLHDARGVMLPLPLSRQDLADLVGCRMETVVRQMTRWAAEGVLQTVREGFVLQRLDLLEELAGIRQPTLEQVGS